MVNIYVRLGKRPVYVKIWWKPVNVPSTVTATVTEDIEKLSSAKNLATLSKKFLVYIRAVRTDALQNVHHY